MSEDEKDRHIRSLIDKINMFELVVEEKAKASAINDQQLKEKIIFQQMEVRKRTVLIGTGDRSVSCILNFF